MENPPRSTLQRGSCGHASVYRGRE